MGLEVRTYHQLDIDNGTYIVKVLEESRSNVLDAWEHTAGILELFR